MGYTNYIKNKPTFTDAQWVAFCQSVREVFAKFPDLLANGSGDKGSKPHIGRAEISFNGRGDNSHETCYIPKAAAEFEFCKTARKPYDEVVVEVYRLVRKYLPATVIWSDGGDEVFDGKRITVNHKYTYLAGDFEVGVGDIVLLPCGHRNRKSYSDGTWEGEVTAIGSDYDGECKTILGVVDKPKVLMNYVAPRRSGSFMADEIADIIKEYGISHENAQQAADHVLGAVIARLKA